MYSVTLGSNCSNIGDSAFANCTSLTFIDIPSSVSSIGSSAFAICTSLPSITIPSSVTTIGTYAFVGCRKLSSITILSSVITIGSYAFDGISWNTYTVTLNWTSEYVANYFYTNLTQKGYNVTYYPRYQPAPTTATVSATYTLTSSGVDPATGNVVTASSTFSATASGNTKDDATTSAHSYAHNNFVLPSASNFSLNYTNVTHSITYSHN